MNIKSPLTQTITVARSMQKNALCTYSNFAVGAAIETNDNVIIGGYNIESASYGLTICAERVALFSALTQGHSTFSHIVLVTDTASFPCGACRQVLYEFCPQATVTIATPTNIVTSCLVQELMPHAFVSSDLQNSKKG